MTNISPGELNLKERLTAVEERNARVEADKAWEVSWLRRGLIVSITYVFAFILLNVLGNDGAWKHATVPVLGYLVSTLSLPAVKKVWIRRQAKQK